MGALLKVCLFVVAMVGLTGCFQIDQVVTVLPDGSGTIEETMLVSRKLVDSMSAFANSMSPGEEGDTAAKPPAKAQSFFKDEEIARRADSFGEGVSFRTSERIVNDRFEGFRAVYAFKNINAIHLESGGLPKQPGVTGGQERKAPEFSFTAGKQATLVMKRPAGASQSAPEQAPSSETAQQPEPGDLEMLRQMFGGLRITTTLVIKGNVVESNATHRSGSVITLAEIDFSKILDKPELLAKMAAVKPGDQEAAMAMLKSFPGMKIDLNDELRVVFK